MLERFETQPLSWHKSDSDKILISALLQIYAVGLKFILPEADCHVLPFPFPFYFYNFICIYLLWFWKLGSELKDWLNCYEIELIASVL